MGPFRGLRTKRPRHMDLRTEKDRASWILFGKIRMERDRARWIGWFCPWWLLRLREYCKKYKVQFRDRGRYKVRFRHRASWKDNAQDGFQPGDFIPPIEPPVGQLKLRYRTSQQKKSMFYILCWMYAVIVNGRCPAEPTQTPLHWVLTQDLSGP